MLTGTWIPQGAEFAGQPVPLRPARLVIAGDRYVVEGADARDEGRLHLAADASPPAVDLVGERGPNAGRTIPAIFRLRGNLLQLCYMVGEGAAPLARPTELQARPGSMQMLVRYRRIAS